MVQFYSVTIPPGKRGPALPGGVKFCWSSHLTEAPGIGVGNINREIYPHKGFGAQRKRCGRNWLNTSKEIHLICLYMTYSLAIKNMQIPGGEDGHSNNWSVHNYSRWYKTGYYPHSDHCTYHQHDNKSLGHNLHIVSLTTFFVALTEHLRDQPLEELVQQLCEAHGYGIVIEANATLICNLMMHQIHLIFHWQ